MPEQFAVDGPFGNCSAVHGDVFVVLSRTVLVYYLWKRFLSGAAFSNHQHREVDWRYLQRAAYCARERLRVSYDGESLFHSLYLVLCGVVHILRFVCFQNFYITPYGELALSVTSSAHRSGLSDTCQVLPGSRIVLLFSGRLVRPLIFGFSVLCGRILL